MRYILFIALIFTGLAASAQTKKHHWLQDSFPFVKFLPGTNVTIDTATVNDTLTITINAPGTGSSATFTPTVTAVTNVAAVTGLSSHYSQKGDVIEVTANLQVTPTASTTLTKFRIDLPVASDLSGGTSLGGIGGAVDAEGFAVARGDTTNNAAEVSFTSWGTSAVIFVLRFSYIIE